MINYTNTAIVTFYDDKERYILAGNRQRESLESIGFPMENYFAFRNYGEFNSPSHNDIPYAFKPYAIQEMRKKGFETIIWMDSAVYAIKQLYEMLYYINLNGFIFFDNLGYTISDYTSDICMNNFDLSREEVFNQALTRNEHFLGFIDEPVVYSDIFVERGKSGVSEFNLRLGEIDNMDELEIYGNGYFNIKKT